MPRPLSGIAGELGAGQGSVGVVREVVKGLWAWSWSWPVSGGRGVEAGRCFVGVVWNTLC